MRIKLVQKLGSHNGVDIYQHDVDEEFNFIVKHGCEFSSCTIWVDEITDVMEGVEVS